MQQQQYAPLRLTANSRKVQHRLLGIAWAYGLFLVAMAVVFRGGIHPQDIGYAAVTILPAILLAAFLPGWIKKKKLNATLVADTEGFRMAGGAAQMPVIPWSEVAALRARRVCGVELVVVIPSNPASLKKRLGQLWYSYRAPGGIAFAVSAFGSAEAIVEQLETYRASARV